MAKYAGEIVGFVSITPPNEHGYSVDKYFPRERVPAVFDRGLYEVRLLTVTSAHRGAALALLLMYAALRYVEALGAHTIVATSYFRQNGSTSTSIRRSMMLNGGCSTSNRAVPSRSAVK